MTEGNTSDRRNCRKCVCVYVVTLWCFKKAVTITTNEHSHDLSFGTVLLCVCVCVQIDEQCQDVESLYLLALYLLHVEFSYFLPLHSLSDLIWILQFLTCWWLSGTCPSWLHLCESVCVLHVSACMYVFLCRGKNRFRHVCNVGVTVRIHI